MINCSWKWKPLRTRFKIENMKETKLWMLNNTTFWQSAIPCGAWEWSRVKWWEGTDNLNPTKLAISWVENQVTVHLTQLKNQRAWKGNQAKVKPDQHPTLKKNQKSIKMGLILVSSYQSVSRTTSLKSCMILSNTSRARIY